LDLAWKGLLLNAIHHRTLESGLFGIHPETLRLLYQPTDPYNEALYIMHDDINHLRMASHPVRTANQARFDN